MSDYKDARRFWSYGQEDSVKEKLTEIGDKLGLEFSQEKIDEATAICTEKHFFCYPAEHQMTDILSGSKEEKGIIFPEIDELLRQFRCKFHEERTNG